MNTGERWRVREKHEQRIRDTFDKLETELVIRDEKERSHVTS